MSTQLRMYRPNLDGLETIIPSEGYQIRTYMDGDEAMWAEIVESAFGSKWDAERCRRELTSLPQFHPEGLFFATYNDSPVGTACAWTQSPDETKSGFIHMVGVLPEHRGRRLGYALCLSVLHFFSERGFQQVSLHTDDFRLPAIKTYLKLGFKPEYIDDDHKARWDNVFEKLVYKG
jgi:mycothiol synthase